VVGHDHDAAELWITSPQGSRKEKKKGCKFHSATAVSRGLRHIRDNTLLK